MSQAAKCALSVPVTALNVGSFLVTLQPQLHPQKRTLLSLMLMELCLGTKRIVPVGAFAMAVAAACFSNPMTTLKERQFLLDQLMETRV